MTRTSIPPVTLNADEADELIWGAENIGRLIGKSKRSTYHLLESELLPAKKIGEQWVASRRRLLAIGDPEEAHS